MEGLGRAAVQAAAVLALAATAQKNAALTAAARAVRAPARRDPRGQRAATWRRARARSLSGALLDRLHLDDSAVEAMPRGIEDGRGAAPIPSARVAARVGSGPTALRIQRVRVPLGVIGIIYESRPNVTADAGALCLKSGNAVILRGGSESAHSSARAPCLPGRRTGSGAGCRRRASSWCRPPIAPPWATCSPA